MDICSKNGGDTSISVNNLTSIVTVNHVTAHSTVENGKGYQYRTLLDFSKVSPEKILSLAAESVIIKARVKYNFRDHATPGILQDLEIDVAEMVKPSKAKKVDPAKVKAQMQKLSPEQRLALLIELGLVEAPEVETEVLTDELPGVAD